MMPAYPGWSQALVTEDIECLQCHRVIVVFTRTARIPCRTVVRGIDIQGLYTRFANVGLKLNPTAAIGPTPFQGSTFRFNSTSTERGDIGGIIQAFVERGKARILSQPRIMTKAGHPATLHAGEEIPSPAGFTIHPGGTNINIKYRKVGITMEVTAHVAGTGSGPFLAPRMPG